MSKIVAINKVIQTYFENNPSVNEVMAKDMMPYFILAGVFEKDVKNGLPIRTILRRLDEKNELYKIPFVYAERKEVNTHWFFQRNAAAPTKKVTETTKSKSVSKSSSRQDSDEHYVLDLCDDVLGMQGLRQHR